MIKAVSKDYANGNYNVVYYNGTKKTFTEENVPEVVLVYLSGRY